MNIFYIINYSNYTIKNDKKIILYLYYIILYYIIN